MDPDGRWTSTRAVLLAAAGQNCWPPAGSYMAATGQDLMAADSASPSVSGAAVGVGAANWLRPRTSGASRRRHRHGSLRPEAPERRAANG